MQKYLWVAVIVLISCTIYFVGCERVPTMLDPLLPDAEQVEPVEPTEMPEEMMEMPVDLVDVLIYTNRSFWITLEDAERAAEITKRRLDSEGIQAEITKDDAYVREWMLHTTGDGEVNVIVLYGVLPASVYGTGNTEPDGSIAENWIETTDGDTILNHADYIAYNTDFDVDKVTEWTPANPNQAVGSNREVGLQNLMDNPNIDLFTAWRTGGGASMTVTSDGTALTPSLVNFDSLRPIPLAQLQGEWFAEKVFASDTGGAQATYADPVIVRDGDRGRLAIVHATTEYEGLLNGEVAAEIIINCLLAPPMMTIVETQPEPTVEMEMPEMPEVVGTPAIYWADTIHGTIYGADLDGTNVREIVTNIGPWDIAVDPSADKIYWTDRNFSGIYEANLDGTNVKEIVRIEQGLPGDILIDLVGNKLYWTNSTAKIQRVNLDGTDLQDVLATGPGLDGIAIDHENGKVYWTEWTAQAIKRANLDGTNVETLISTGVRGPRVRRFGCPGWKNVSHRPYRR